MARYAGLNDDLIRRLEEKRQRAMQKNAPVAAPKSQDKGILDFLSMGTGIGGALGGAAAGAATGSVVPGVGTAIGGILGALLGGGLGSAGGEVAENAITGDQWDKNVLQEGLIGGATSLPVGAAFKLARAGVKAGTGFGRVGAREFVNEAGVQTLGKKRLATMEAGGRLDDSALAGLERIRGGGRSARPGRVAEVGTDLQRSAANTTKVADSYSDELGIIDALNRNGITGSASNMYKTVDTKLGELSGQIDDQLSLIKKTMARPTAIKSLQRRVTDILPEDPTYGRELQRSLDRLSKSGSGKVTASELFNFKKQLGNRLSPAFKKLNRGAALTSKEEVDMALWRSLDDDITKLAPEVKQLTMDQSRLITARPGLQSASQKTAGIPLLGVKSQSLEQGAQSARNRAGRLLEGSQGAPSAARPIGQSLLGTTVRQGAGRALMPPQGEVDETGLPAPLMDEQAIMQGQQQEPSVGGVTKSQLEQAMMMAAADGNEDAFGQLEAMYKLLPEPADQGSLPVEGQKAIANATAGLQSLGDLEGMIQGDANVVQKAAAPDLAPLNSLLGTSEYRAAIKNVQDTMSRLRSGASMTEQESARFDQMLPRFGDSQETIAYKTQQFRDYFQNVIGNAERGRGGGGSGIAAALASAGY